MSAVIRFLSANLWLSVFLAFLAGVLATLFFTTSSLQSLLSFIGTNQWVVTLFAALGALVVGLLAMDNIRSVNRRRATIDMISEKIWDKDYIDASNTFYELLSDQKRTNDCYDQFRKGASAKLDGRWPGLSETERQELQTAIDQITIGALGRLSINGS